MPIFRGSLVRKCHETKSHFPPHDSLCSQIQERYVRTEYAMKHVSRVIQNSPEIKIQDHIRKFMDEKFAESDFNGCMQDKVSRK
jgi:hypothetical protein